MRWLAVLLGLTACYRPGSDAPCTVTCSAAATECPDGLICNTEMGRCALASGGCRAADATLGKETSIDSPIDSSIDSSIDAASSVLCAVSTTVLADASLTGGTWFIADRGAQRAVKEEAGVIVGLSGDPDTTMGSSYSDLFANVPAGTTYRAPRLAPGAGELFLLKQVITGYSIAQSTRTGEIWSSPQSLAFKDQSGTFDVSVDVRNAPGAPTTTVPRRILVSENLGFNVAEFREITGTNEWRHVQSHPTSFGTVNILGQATLSENGRRMVFTGQEGGGIVSGYYVDRANVGDPFAAPATKLAASPLSVRTPYLTADCKHYYYSDPNAPDVIHHVTYQ